MSPASAPDDRLARLAAGGDNDAFAAIYARYHQPLYRYCFSILRNAEDARDALQATMERALRSIGGQRVEGGLRAWLFKIAHNEALTALGRRPAGVPVDEASPHGADAATESADRDRLRQLVDDLGSLPEQQRSALVLRELSGLDSEEIASALAVSPAAARQSVYEARVALTTIAEGRDMSCAGVQQRISDGDGRRLRGRRVRAHLRECALCQAFSAGIQTRTADFPLLFPPLAAAAAAETLGAVTGGAVTVPPGDGGAAVGSGDGAAAAADQPAGRSLVRDRRTQVAAGAVALLLAIVGVLGFTGGDDPPERAKASTPNGSSPGGAPQPTPGGDRPEPPATTARQDPGVPATVAGYSQLDPSVTATIARAGADEGASGDGDGSAGGALAFTGLDVLALLLAGGALLGLGVLMRRLAASPAA